MKKKYEFGRIAVLASELRRAMVQPGIIKQIMAGGEKILRRTKPADKAAWLKKAMDRMDKLLPKEVRYRVREECACCTKGARRKLVKKLKDENPKLDDFFRAVDKSRIFGEKVERKGNKVYVDFGLTRCVCTTKASKELVSITYCHCCKGHVIKLLEIALRKPLRGDVVCSACSGGDSCRFIIYLD